ncbi:hypothetical protein C8J56DRAFT_902763 [Mycena floridula]|nr:hypothetical protein C8J56DRAFT_902763 [Mycena floridula]
MPQLMHEFNRKQCAHFLQKDIEPEDQIIDNHHDEIVKMDWPTFMKWMKEHFLPEKWAEELLTELMGTKMRKGDSFKDFSEDMVFSNHLLEGTKQHQSDVQLRTQVTVNLLSVLHSHAFSIIAETYDAWADALIKQIKEDEDLSKRLTVSNAEPVPCPVKQSVPVPEPV